MNGHSSMRDINLNFPDGSLLNILAEPQWYACEMSMHATHDEQNTAMTKTDMLLYASKKLSNPNNAKLILIRLIPLLPLPSHRPPDPPQRSNCQGLARR